ncbi:MAG: hypothetical protein RIM23_18145 [Coleofasciculus sp. G3-WIS-01]
MNETVSKLAEDWAGLVAYGCNRNDSSKTRPYKPTFKSIAKS